MIHSQDIDQKDVQNIIDNFIIFVADKNSVEPLDSYARLATVADQIRKRHEGMNGVDQRFYELSSAVYFGAMLAIDQNWSWTHRGAGFPDPKMNPNADLKENIEAVLKVGGIAAEFARAVHAFGERAGQNLNGLHREIAVVKAELGEGFPSSRAFIKAVAHDFIQPGKDTEDTDIKVHGDPWPPVARRVIYKALHH